MHFSPKQIWLDDLPKKIMFNDLEKLISYLNDFLHSHLAWAKTERIKCVQILNTQKGVYDPKVLNCSQIRKIFLVKKKILTPKCQRKKNKECSQFSWAKNVGTFLVSMLRNLHFPGKDAAYILSWKIERFSHTNS